MIENKYSRNSLRYSREKCIGCGMCAAVCPHRVFSMDGKKAVLRHKERCMECGACQKNCPAAAIEVDSGVGCAAAMMLTAVFGSKKSCCGDCGCTSDALQKKKDCCGR